MSPEDLRVLIVDDEAIARRRLLRMIDRIDGVVPVGSAKNVSEAKEILAEHEVDLILLDIQMPGIDGMSFAREERGLPSIIFTTAHSEYAVEAFEAEAVDYLLKPIEPSRLESAIGRARERDRSVTSEELRALVSSLSSRSAAQRLTARTGDTTIFFDPSAIRRFHSEDKYTRFVQNGKGYLLEDSISELERRLETSGFIRVHRSELVNMKYVRALHKTARGYELELDDGQRAKVSRRKAPAVLKALGLER